MTTARRSLMCLAAAALAAATALPAPALGAGDDGAPLPRIHATFIPSRVQVGGLVTLEVRASGLRGAGSASFHLVYDPTRLAPVPSGSSEGRLFRRDGSRTRFLAQASSTGDRIIVGLTRLGRRRGARGDGIVARFVFRSLSPGLATVVFDQAEIADPGAKPMPARFLPGDLLVMARKEDGRGR